MPLAPLAFASYNHDDNEQDDKFVHRFCDKLQKEVRTLTGAVQFRLFIDRDIEWGDIWRDRIDRGLGDATFLIPFVTPLFFTSNECLRELDKFRAMEEERGRKDLILPLYYISASAVEHPDDPQHSASVAAAGRLVRERQYEDWRRLRNKDINAPEVREATTCVAKRLLAAIKRVATVPPKLSGSLGTARTLIVDQESAGGHYATLQEALAAAQPGCIIQLRPGVHRVGEARVDQTVDIVGEGDIGATVLEVSGEFGIRFVAETCQVKNVAVKRVGQGYGSAITLGKGRTEFQRCRIESSDGVGVRVQDGASGAVLNCHIENGLYALVADGKTEVRIEGCTIVNARGAAFSFLFGAKPTVRRNTLMHCANSAWTYFDGGGSYSDNNWGDAQPPQELKGVPDGAVKRPAAAVKA